MLEVREAPPMSGETLDATHRRHEHELGELWARLSVLDARALDCRLTIVSPDGRLGSRFGRLVVERRTQLLALVGDARRREAIAQARKVEGSAR